MNKKSMRNLNILIVSQTSFIIWRRKFTLGRCLTQSIPASSENRGATL